MPATRNHDFEFAIFGAVSGGARIGSTKTLNSVAAAEGTFAVKLDFGNEFPRTIRFLEIRVRQASGRAFAEQPELNPKSKRRPAGFVKLRYQRHG